MFKVLKVGDNFVKVVEAKSTKTIIPLLSHHCNYHNSATSSQSICIALLAHTGSHVTTGEGRPHHHLRSRRRHWSQQLDWHQVLGRLLREEGALREGKRKNKEKEGRKNRVRKREVSQEKKESEELKWS